MPPKATETELLNAERDLALTKRFAPEVVASRI
jgi:hypothetical protein